MTVQSNSTRETALILLLCICIAIAPISGIYVSTILLITFCAFLKRSIIAALFIIYIYSLIKINLNGALVSEDLEATYLVYRELSSGGPVLYEYLWPTTEPATNFIYKYILPSGLDLENFSAAIYLIFFVLLALLIYRETKSSAIVMIVLIMVDTIFVIHIYRQSLMLVLLLTSLSYWRSGLRIKAYFFSTLSILTHNSAIAFLLVTIVVTNLLYNKKSIMGAKTLGIFLIMYQFLSPFNYSFILELTNSFGEYGSLLSRLTILNNTNLTEPSLRIAFVFSFFIALFIRSTGWLFRVYITYALTYILICGLPFMGQRIGMISASILVGFPIAILCVNLSSLLVLILSNKNNLKCKEGIL